MSQVGLDEEAIDDILYLARVNETADLDAFLADLCSKTKQPKAAIVAAARDAYSQNTALHYAAANGHIDVIKLLFSYGADKVAPSAPDFINALNGAGNTALHWAALNGHLESVKLLIHAGADVTIINGAGHDAVFEAELNDKKEVVEWLLGAVEELEAGVGRTGTSAKNGEDESMDVDGGLEQSNSKGIADSTATGVKDMEKQMEGLKTDDSSPTGG